MDKKLEKLEFVRDSFWTLFAKTGNIYNYGRYRGACELVKERKQELENMQSMQK